MVINKLIKIKFGFTLVEILVSLFIIVTLTTVLLVNYHSTNRRAALITAAQKLASDIRLAQEYSLGSKEFKGQVPFGGWGVYFDINSPDRYIIFADQDPPSGDKKYNTGEEFKTIILPPGITIDSLTAFYSSFYSSVNTLSIVFFPPDPITHINSDYKKAKITLKEQQNNTTKTIEINFFGLIDAIN